MIFMDMFTYVGDALALQYGGSETNKRVGEKEEGREEGGKEEGEGRMERGGVCWSLHACEPTPSLPSNPQAAQARV